MLTDFLVPRLLGRFAIAAMSCVLVTVPAGVNAAEPETLETVLAVWRKREEATKTVRVVIGEESQMAEMVGPEGELLGGTAKMQQVIVLDGTNMRTERVGEMLNSVAKHPDRVTMYEVIDGRRSKSLTHVSREDAATRSNGWIHDRDRHTEVQNFYLSPVLRHWRPLTPAWGLFALDKLTLVSTEEKIRAERCVLLEQPYGMAVARFWVAPEKEMALVRTTVTKGDFLMRELDVSLKHDDKLGWLPASWKATSFGRDGRAAYSGTYTVTESKVNLDVPKETFDIVFPPGTEVYDSVAKKKFFVPLEK